MHEVFLPVVSPRIYFGNINNKIIFFVVRYNIINKWRKTMRYICFHIYNIIFASTIFYVPLFIPYLKKLIPKKHHIVELLFLSFIFPYYGREIVEMLARN